MISNLSRQTWNSGNGNGSSLAEYMERQAEQAEYLERRREERALRASEIRRAIRREGK